MNREIQQRLIWVNLYNETKDTGFVCRRCGISRPTLRKWGSDGADILRKVWMGLLVKVDDHTIHLIQKSQLILRTGLLPLNLGASRIQSELRRLNSISLSLATIHKILHRNRVKPKKIFRKKKDFIRYEGLYRVIECKWIPVK